MKYGSGEKLDVILPLKEGDIQDGFAELQRRLLSLLLQNYHPLHIHIVVFLDDLLVLPQLQKFLVFYTAMHANITIHKIPQKRQGSCFSLLFSHEKLGSYLEGYYLSYLPADRLLYPQACKQLVELLKEKDDAVAFGSFLKTRVHFLQNVPMVLSKKEPGADLPYQAKHRVGPTFFMVKRQAIKKKYLLEDEDLQQWLDMAVLRELAFQEGYVCSPREVFLGEMWVDVDRLTAWQQFDCQSMMDTTLQQLLFDVSEQKYLWRALGPLKPWRLATASSSINQIFLH